MFDVFVALCDAGLALVNLLGLQNSHIMMSEYVLGVILMYQELSQRMSVVMIIPPGLRVAQSDTKCVPGNDVNWTIRFRKSNTTNLNKKAFEK